MIKPAPTFKYAAEGTIAHIALQCTDPKTETVGDWLFVGENHRVAGTRVSPIFTDYLGLVCWCRENGWAEVPGKTQVIKTSSLGISL